MVTTFGLSFDALEKEFDPVKAKILSLVNLPRKYHFYGCKVFVKKWPFPASFSFIVGLFLKIKIQFLQHINVKIVHSVSHAGIRTHAS